MYAIFQNGHTSVVKWRAIRSYTDNARINLRITCDRLDVTGNSTVVVMDDNKVGQLIDEVQSRPILWNKRLPQHSNTILVGKEWAKVAANLRLTSKYTCVLLLF